MSGYRSAKTFSALHLSASDAKGSFPNTDVHVSDDSNSCSYMVAAAEALGSSVSGILTGQPSAASSLGFPRPTMGWDGDGGGGQMITVITGDAILHWLCELILLHLY